MKRYERQREAKAALRWSGDGQWRAGRWHWQQVLAAPEREGVDVGHDLREGTDGHGLTATRESCALGGGHLV